jgi:hypothetical protein
VLIDLEFELCIGLPWLTCTAAGGFRPAPAAGLSDN